MLQKARARADRWPAGVQVALVEADFNYPGWIERLPTGVFDVGVSGFAIHHSVDADKRRIYAGLFGVLDSGGVLVHCEHVASPSPLGERLFERLQAESIAAFRAGRGENVALDAVIDELRARPDRVANRLTVLETQIEWLREIGFEDVDCYWKRFELAVFGGFRR